jgi:hypothetical protein
LPLLYFSMIHSKFFCDCTQLIQHHKYLWKTLKIRNSNIYAIGEYTPIWNKYAIKVANEYNFDNSERKWLERYYFFAMNELAANRTMSCIIILMQQEKFVIYF